MKSEQILEAIKKVREISPQKKFRQTFDLAITLKELDLKKPESKIKEEVLLPHRRGKTPEIGAFAEGVLAENSKKAGIKTIFDKAGLQELGVSKSKAKKLASKIDVFIASPDLMVDVGKNLGPVLAPRNKMPKPVLPQTDLKSVIERFSKVVNLRIKDQPVIHCPVGSEAMSDTQIQENVESVLSALQRKLPKGEANIRAIYLKLTMGPAVKVRERAAEVKK